MSTELIINASLPETRIALMENGEIQDLLIERASGKGIVGNIYKGRVTRVLPGMQAAFVDIGLEKAAFLYVDDVYVRPEIWEAEEGEPEQQASTPGVAPVAPLDTVPQAADVQAAGGDAPSAPAAPVVDDAEAAQWQSEVDGDDEEGDEEGGDDHGDPSEDQEDDADDDHGPEEMGPPPGEGGEGDGGSAPQGTVGPSGGGEGSGGGDSAQAGGQGGQDASRRRHRRGRRGGRFRRRDGEAAEGGGQQKAQGGGQDDATGEDLPDSYHDQVADAGQADSSDRGEMTEQNQKANAPTGEVQGEIGRPEAQTSANAPSDRSQQTQGRRPEFREPRSRDRRIKSNRGSRPPRVQANIQDLLKEGQEVIVQVAKDPISTKGARLTCHISLPGRHLVCMPTIDHVGVSRRIERDDERRKLREHVERYRPRGLGFIVRTASGKGQSERRIKQDIEYLSSLWSEIKDKAGQVTAPALVYEDLNSVLRAIRDWVTEDIDKIVVDSRYHYNDIIRFVSHFMPVLKQKIELYHGDVPIFDAYTISTELARGLERKVWLKSGGYIVVDQAEALVAIDVNTGRFVGKKNLEDTILKTNLEAVQEIAYQLRLRNCGGIIILDLIDMEREENKQRVYRALEEALKKDRARPSILKISELGLVEMTRKRTRDTMVRALCDSCSLCEGKGFIKSKVTVAYEILRELERVGIERDTSKVLVQAHPDVIDILAIEERDTLDQLERRYRKQVFLQSVLDYHLERFEITGEKRDRNSIEPTQVLESRGGRDRDGEREQNGGSGSGGRNDRGDRGGNRDRGDRDRGRNRNRGRDRNTQGRGGANNLPRAVDPMAHVNRNSEQAPTDVLPVGHLPQPGTEGYSDEDRLAFLRAQAAQDAALAKVGGQNGQNGSYNRDRDRGRGRHQNQRNNSQPQPQQQAGGGDSAGAGEDMGLGRAPVEGGGHGGEDRKRGRRGRRGGRHRRGGRDGERPVQGRGPGGEGGNGGSGAPGAGMSSGGSDAGGGSSGGGDTSGGGSSAGGHSTPPTV